MSLCRVVARESHRIVAVDGGAQRRKMSYFVLNMIASESVLVESSKCLQLI